MAEWFYAKYGETHGPISQDELMGLFATGALDADDYVWREGMAAWKPAGSVAELGLRSRAGAPPPPPRGEGIHGPSPYYQPVSETSGKAVASLVFSIVGWFVCVFVGQIVGIILGHQARAEIRESGGRLTGEGLATAGIIIGWIGIVLDVVGVVMVLMFLLAVAAA